MKGAKTKTKTKTRQEVRQTARDKWASGGRIRRNHEHSCWINGICNLYRKHFIVRFVPHLSTSNNWPFVSKVWAFKCSGHKWTNLDIFDNRHFHTRALCYFECSVMSQNLNSFVAGSVAVYLKAQEAYSSIWEMLHFRENGKWAIFRNSCLPSISLISTALASFLVENKTIQCKERAEIAFHFIFLLHRESPVYLLHGPHGTFFFVFSPARLAKAISFRVTF